MEPLWRSILLFIICLVYLFVGAGIFSLLESHEEQVIRVSVNNTINEFLTNHPEVSMSELKMVLEAINDAAYMGIDAEDVAEKSYHNQWDVVNAFYFCASVITTIGYGHLTPNTHAGKVVYGFYAFFGIPLMAWFLLETGMMLKVHLLLLAQKIQNGLSYCCSNDLVTRIITGILLFFAAYLNLLVIPAAIIGHIEDWSHMDAEYFCFTSITTIGFGDLIPTENLGFQSAWAEWIYKLCTVVYYFTGMVGLVTIGCILYEVRPGVKSIAHKRMLDTSGAGTGGQNHLEEQMGDVEERELALGHLALQSADADAHADAGMHEEDDYEDDDVEKGDGKYRKL